MAWEKLYNDQLAFYEHKIIINLRPNINLSFYNMRKILLGYKDGQIKKSIAAELKREGYDVLPIREESLNFTALDSAYLDLVATTLCADVASTWDMFFNFKEYFSDSPIIVYMGRCGPGRQFPHRVVQNTHPRRWERYVARMVAGMFFRNPDAPGQAGAGTD